MFFWFCGMSVLTVWLVFKDPAIDLRMVILGAVLPDLIDLPFGGARMAHSVVFPVTVLTVVMLATRGHRHLRRNLVMVAVGLFGWPLKTIWVMGEMARAIALRSSR